MEMRKNNQKQNKIQEEINKRQTHKNKEINKIN